MKKRAENFSERAHALKSLTVPLQSRYDSCPSYNKDACGDQYYLGIHHEPLFIKYRRSDIVPHYKAYPAEHYKQ